MASFLILALAYKLEEEPTKLPGEVWKTNKSLLELQSTVTMSFVKEIIYCTCLLLIASGG